MSVPTPHTLDKIGAGLDRPEEEAGPLAWDKRRGLAIAYCATILASAFLLFQIQPLMGNVLLPRFGGSASVWGVCLVFFQSVLLAGYLYAHLVTRALPLRYQLIVHVALLAVTATLLRVLPGENSPQDVSRPTMGILLLLSATVGLPYLLLSSTSPLLQAWLAKVGSREPYGLYALSNLGSMLGLLSYPFFVQPLIGVRQQAQFWSVGFIIFFILSALAAIGTTHLANTEKVLAAPPPRTTGMTRGRFGVWLGLAACPSAMLLATTNVLCMDVAPAPFLWVVPLSLYLLTMIICFARPSLHRRRVWAILAIAALLATAWAVNQKASALSLMSQIALYNGCLFAVCMMCHGELVRQRPPAEQLTWFYLASSLGGALGGIFVAIVAPQVFQGFFEYKAVSVVSVLLAAVFLALSLASSPRPSSESGKRRQTKAPSQRDGDARWRLRSLVIVLAAVLAYAAVLFGAAEKDDKSRLVAMQRDFYGVVSVHDLNPQEPTARCLLMLHGRIRHGAQLVRPDGRRWPLLYFHADSGVGQAIRYARARTGPLRVGVVGLGCGTLAAYAEAGDYIRFYEISPVVIEMAKQHFSYLTDAPTKVDCVLGDGRISLEHEPPQEFDVLVIDAFSGDAIPLHLLTKEAMDIYLKHLKPSGILAFHVTNNHVDLTGPVHALAESSAMMDVQVLSAGDPMRGYAPARWHLLARDEAFVRQMVQEKQGIVPATNWREPWFDDTCNLLSVLR